MANKETFTDCVRHVCKPVNRLLHPNMLDAILPWITSSTNDGIPEASHYPANVDAKHWMKTRLVVGPLVSLHAEATAYGAVYAYTDWHIAQRTDLRPVELEMYRNLLRLDEEKASKALHIAIIACSRSERDEL